jgi:hypothetical protein
MFMEISPLHPGSSPDMTIYNDINRGCVKPQPQVFSRPVNAAHPVDDAGVMALSRCADYTGNAFEPGI